MYFAWVLLETNASIAQRHDDVSSARRWIDEERNMRPELFLLGQIFEGSPAEGGIVAICDLHGWQSER